MKKNYEVSLMRHVAGSVEDDFETVDYAGVGCNYRECVKIAKEKSMIWDACNVICYANTEDCSYEIIFQEQYIQGKKQWREDWTKKVFNL
jgi:hypothetical protein